MSMSQYVNKADFYEDKIRYEKLRYENLVKHIQDALGTAETGNALIEVARNAHKAEMELASYYNLDDET